MERYRILYEPQDRKTACRLQSALTGVTLDRAIQDRYGIDRKFPMRPVGIIPADLAGARQVPFVLLISSASVGGAVVEACLDGEIGPKDFVPVVAELRHVAQKEAASRVKSRFIERDLLVIDLDSQEEGWQDGPLKIAARLLDIPFGVLRDREHERKIARTRFNLFATAGLLSISVVAALFWWQATIATAAAVEASAGALFLSDGNMTDLARYARVPGSSAPAAIDAMATNLTRIDKLAYLFPRESGLEVVGKTASIKARISLAMVLLSREQFDRAIALLNETHASLLAADFPAGIYIDATLFIDPSTHRFAIELILAEVYRRAGLYQESLSEYLATAQREREALEADPTSAAACARLTEALTAATLVKGMTQTQQDKGLGSEALAECRNCLSSIEQGPLSGDPLPPITALAGVPRSGQELRLGLAATIELAALAAEPSASETFAKQWRRAEKAVQELESVAGENASPARGLLSSHRTPSDTEIEVRIAKSREKITKSPHDSRLRVELAQNLGVLASRLSAAKKPGGRILTEEAESILTHLVGHDPGNLFFQSELAAILASEANDAAQAGDCPRALRARDESVRHYRALVEAQEADAKWRRNLISIEGSRICDSQT